MTENESPKGAQGNKAPQPDPIATENQRATLIVRRIPVGEERYVVQFVANTMEFTVGQPLSAVKVKELTASPKFHVSVV